MVIGAQENHWPAIKEIYVEGIKTGNATFEEVDSIGEYADWMAKKVSGSVFVFEDNGSILGWASLSKVSDRCVYGGVAEVSVYVSQDKGGRGIGKALLKSLIDYSEANNFWSLQAGIFPENKASLALHEKMGFRKVGVREKLGKMKGIWRDVVMFERRSSTIF